MRERIYTIVNKAEKGDKLSSLYDGFIMCVAFISIIPMMFRQMSPQMLHLIETPTVYLLFFDYILRWITYDYRVGKHKIWAFFLYPVTPLALMDIFGILPSLGLLPASFKILRLLRLAKILRYSKSGRRIMNVFSNQGKTLLSVLIIAIAYIFISALVMFAYEPADNFPHFFDALYWSTTALTTVGYGDIYPCTDIGKFISMLSSLFGVAVIAMPASIVTAGFMEELNRDLTEQKEAAVKAEGKAAEPGKDIPKRNVQYTRYGMIMALSVVLNIGLYWVAHTFHLPAWLDAVGTAFAAVALEPAAGLIVAFATNFFQSAVVFGASSIVYYFTGAVIALAFGILVRKGGEIQWKRLLPAAVVGVLSAALVSTLLTFWRTAGVPDSNWEQHFYNMALAAHVPKVLACYFGIAVLKVADCAVIAGLLPILCKLTPNWMITKKLEEQFSHKSS